MLVAAVISFGWHWALWVAAAWGLVAVQEAHVAWTTGCRAELRGACVAVVFSDPVRGGTSPLVCIARAGRLARREPPFGTDSRDTLQCIWHFPGAGMLPVYSLLLPVGHGVEVRACAAIQARVVDAEVRNHPLEAIFGQCGWLSPVRGAAMSTSAAVPERIDWLLVPRHGLWLLIAWPQPWCGPSVGSTLAGPPDALPARRGGGRRP